MENYINAQQEIVNRAAQISARHVIVFLDEAMACDSRNRTNGMRLSEELRERYNISIPKPEYVWTENPFLKGKVIGRPLTIDKAEEYPVLVGNVRDYRKYASAFAKETHEELRKIIQEDVQVIWIPNKQGDTNLPTMVSCQFADKPEQCPRLLDSSLSLISAKIPQSKDEMLAKLDVLFEEAAYKKYDMNEMIDMLKKKYGENAAINYDEYGLRFDYDYTSNEATTFERFDIYVKKNDTPLKLQAIEKATYLAYILFNDGDGVMNSIPLRFQQTLADIYNKMADNSIKDRDFGGIMSSKIYDSKINGYNRLAITTIAGYRSAINKEINKHIPIRRLAQDFGIEGIKDQPFKVAKSTFELREQIRRLFQVK